MEYFIKKCPFCGGEGVLVNKDNWGANWVECDECGAKASKGQSLDENGEKEAVDNWNMRVGEN